MNRKKLVSIWLVITMSLVVSLTGCNRFVWATMRPVLQIDRGPFIPFTPVDYETPSIDHPVQSWTYNWPENNAYFLGAETEPLVDNDGNVYLIGKNGDLYSIDTYGNLRWNVNKKMKSIALAQEGFVIEGQSSSLVLADSDKNVKWVSKGCWGRYKNEFYFAPNGYLVFFDYGYIVGLDAQGKTIWVYTDDEYIVKNCFFDENSNAYITYGAFYTKEDPRFKEGRENHEYYMISLSPEGKLRWKKPICNDRNYIQTFTPKDNRIKDVFLLALSTASSSLEDKNAQWDDSYEGVRQSPKVIKAFNTDGEELWQMQEERSGYYDTQYTVGNDDRLYFSFNSYLKYPKEPSSKSPPDTFMCVSKTGEHIWDVEFKDDIATAPSLDSEGNIYIGIVSYRNNDHIYSFFPDGTSRWVLNDIEVASGFKSNLILSPQGKIHFTTLDQNLLFCIEEAQE